MVDFADCAFFDTDSMRRLCLYKRSLSRKLACNKNLLYEQECIKEAVSDKTQNNHTFVNILTESKV